MIPFRNNEFKLSMIKLSLCNFIKNMYFIKLFHTLFPPILINELINWLIIYCVHVNGVTHENISFTYMYIELSPPVKRFKIQCLAFTAYEHGGIFIVPHLLWHMASVLQSQSRDHPSVVFNDNQLFWSGPPHDWYFCEIQVPDSIL